MSLINDLFTKLEDTDVIAFANTLREIADKLEADDALTLNERLAKIDAAAIEVRDAWHPLLDHAVDTLVKWSKERIRAKDERKHGINEDDLKAVIERMFANSKDSPFLDRTFTFS